MTISKFIKFVVLSFFFTLAFQFAGGAQESGLLYFLPGVSQSSLSNPAFQNKTDKLVIGLPVLSGIQFDWNANIAINSLSPDNFASYSFATFFDALDEIGNGRFAGNIIMFYASLKKQDWNFSVSLCNRTKATTTFDRNIVKLIRDGTSTYYGSNENFGSGSFNFNYYRELAFGFSNKVSKQLNVGIRPKILFGQFFFDTKNLNFSVETNTKNRELILKPESSFTLSAPLKYNSDPVKNFVNFSGNVLPGDYFFNARNLGLAVDLGIDFRPNKQYEFTASLLDIGFVGYKHNTVNVNFTKPIRYQDNNLYQSVSPNEIHYLEPREALKAFGDSVSFIISAQNNKLRTFTTLSMKVNVSGKYNFSKTFSGGVVNQFLYNGKYSGNQLSGFLHSILKDKFEGSGSLTLYNFSKVFVGIGGSYTSGFFQVYFSTNNLLGIIQPSAAKNLNLCFGINLLFATKNY